MVDFHTHILPGIDDGSRNIEETITLLKEAEENGFDKIILTPHYLENTYEENEEIRSFLLEKVKQCVPQSKLELYLASEIYVTYNMIELLKEKQASTINKTRYVLFELPMNRKISNLNSVVYGLLENKYIPVIAHPERYKYVQEDPNMLIDLINLGVLFQANFGSLIGIYGNEAKKTVKLLLKSNMIHFMGSDVHMANTIYPQMNRIMKELNKVISEDKIQEITELNPNLVLQNKEIPTEEPQKIKKFGLF